MTRDTSTAIMAGENWLADAPLAGVILTLVFLSFGDSFMSKLGTPQQVAQKWQQRTSAASQAMTDGVNAVTESPMAKAAANPQKYVDGVMRAVNDGSWVAGLNKKTLAEWKQDMIQKGIPRVSQGTQAAVPKMQNFVAKFFPILQQNMAAVNAMPNNTLEDRLAKMVQMARLNSQFKLATS